MTTAPRTRSRAYLIATVAVVVAVALRMALIPLIGERFPFATVLLAVMIVSVRYGLKPGLAAAISGIVGSLFLMPPVGSPWVEGYPLLPGLGLYAIVAGAAAFTGAASHEARQQAEATADALRRSEEHLQVTLSSIGDAVIATDAGGRVTWLNPKARALTGWGDDALGQPIASVMPLQSELTNAPTSNPSETVLRDGITVALADHTSLVARDGTLRPIEDTAAPIRGPDGAVRGCVVVFHDVTEARVVRRQLEEREALFRAVIDHSPSSIFAKDSQGRYLLANRSAAALIDRQPDELVGKMDGDLVSPEMAAAFAADDARVLSSGEARTYEEMMTVGSRQIVSLTTKFPLRDASGAIYGVCGISTDITSLRHTERALRDSEERLRLALEAGHMGVWDWNVATGALAWSDTLEPIHGLEPGTFAGTFEAFRALVHPDDRPQVEAAIEGALAARSSYDIEFRVVWPDGQIHWIAGKGQVFTDEQGQASRMIGIGMDVTERRQAHQALEEADRRKDDFLATLAHELRNPLASIRHSVELLRRGQDDPELLMHARGVMERQLQQLVRLIDDLLDVSRITRDRLELRKEPVLLSSVLESALEATRPMIEEAGHALVLDLPEEPLWLDADLTRLAQVFSNLLSNATKYTPRGGRIELRAERTGQEVRVSVRDNGQGIKPEHLPQLFLGFAQPGPVLERSQGGLGIGLALVRALVERHGGRVQARSAGPGQGSEFSVSLPLGQAPEPRPAPAEPSEPAPRRILVVDDNVDAAQTLAMLLEMMGQQVEIAHDGVEAVEAEARFAPDLVLLDIGMPRMNGYEAARQIRVRAGDGPMLVALTGWGQEDDRQRAKDAGFDLHLTKPVDPDTLLHLLTDLPARKRP